MFSIVVKIYAKADTKVFWSCTILHDSFNLFQIFFPGLSVKVNIYLKVVPDSFKLKYFDIFHKDLCKYRGENLWKSSRFKIFCKHYLECLVLVKN